MAEKWVEEISPQVRALMDSYWPGGLTLILPTNREDIQSLVKGGTSTLGVRMPDHTELLQIIENVGVPIIGSSANFEGETTPYVFDDLDSELVDLVDYVLPGECKTKQASTVLDCTAVPFRVLREGAVTLVHGS
jgi:L-threonylcarbamoyladenylate synthase